jgi:hypothetical protein
LVVAPAGRLVALGLESNICIYSDDNGQAWAQIIMPVSGGWWTLVMTFPGHLVALISGTAVCISLDPSLLREPVWRHFTGDPGPPGPPGDTTEDIEAAREAAEAARDTALDYRDAALGAQQAAESARDFARDDMNAAAESASAAAGSAEAAAASALAAAESAAAAAGGSSGGDPDGSAAESAVAAAESAEAAAGSAEAAASSATAASGSAIAAAGSATTAVGSATSASESAEAAAGSAASATGSATTAAGSATSASGSASAAAGSATAAGSARIAAEEAQAAAETAALNAVLDLTAHNTDTTAHSAIQTKIGTDISTHNSNAEAHSDIRTKISTDIGTHNSATTSHAALKASNTETRLMALTDKLVTPFGLGYALQAVNVAAGADLNNFTEVKDLGWWSFNAGNAPANAPATGQGFLYVTRLSTTSETERVLQLWVSPQYSDTVYIRTRGSVGAWVTWQKIMTESLLQAVLNTHNSNPEAHPDIRELASGSGGSGLRVWNETEVFGADGPELVRRSENYAGDTRIFETLAPSGPGTAAGVVDPTVRLYPLGSAGGAWLQSSRGVLGAVESEGFSSILVLRTGRLLYYFSELDMDGYTEYFGYYYSDNNGQSWTRVSGVDSFSNSPLVVTPTGRIIASDSYYGRIYYSDNNGSTYSQVSLPVSFSTAGMIVTPTGRIIVLAYNSTVCIYSDDDGLTWSQTALPTWGYSYSIAVTPAGRVIALVYNSNIYLYSDDNGSTWSQSTLPVSAYWKGAIAVMPTGRIVAIAYGSNICIYSDNNGQAWTQITLPVSAYWIGLVLTPTGRLVALGSSVCIYSDNDGLAWTQVALPVAVSSQYGAGIPMVMTPDEYIVGLNIYSAPVPGDPVWKDLKSGVAVATGCINANGSIAYGFGIVSATKTATGTYQVNHAASNRIAVASSQFSTGLFAGVQPVDNNVTVTKVFIRNYSGTMTDSIFFIAIY